MSNAALTALTTADGGKADVAIVPNPWKLGTLIGDAFALACRPDGVRWSVLERKCLTAGNGKYRCANAETGSSYARIRYYMRHGNVRSIRWSYEDDGETLRIHAYVPIRKRNTAPKASAVVVS